MSLLFANSRQHKNIVHSTLVFTMVFLGAMLLNTSSFAFEPSGDDFVKDCKFSRCLVMNGDDEVVPVTSSRPLVVVTDLFGDEHYSKIEVVGDSPYLWAVAHSDKLNPGVYVITSTNNQTLLKKTLIIQAQ